MSFRIGGPYLLIKVACISKLLKLELELELELKLKLRGRERTKSMYCTVWYPNAFVWSRHGGTGGTAWLYVISRRGLSYSPRVA